LWLVACSQWRRSALASPKSSYKRDFESLAELYRRMGCIPGRGLLAHRRCRPARRVQLGRDMMFKFSFSPPPLFIAISVRGTKSPRSLGSLPVHRVQTHRRSCRPPSSSCGGTGPPTCAATRLLSSTAPKVMKNCCTDTPVIISVRQLYKVPSVQVSSVQEIF
jgi:hypothetical protein